MCTAPMDLLPNTITTPVARIGAAAQNALEVARFGGLETHEEPSPYEVVHEHRVYRLRRYYADDGEGRGAPILLVPPMMLAAEVYDVSPEHQRGHDPARERASTRGWSTSARPSTRRAAWSGRSPTTCSRSPTRSIRCARRPGSDVHLGGYSQGGMFCYQTAAYRRNECARLGDHVRQPGRHPAGDAVRDPRAVRGGRRRRARRPRLRRLGAAGVGEPHRLPPARSGQVAAQPARLRARSCTTARRCCRASASGASSRRRAGSPGRARRWPTSCASSSPTTGCSRAGS